MEANKKVIVCNEYPYNGKWFYVHDGIKNWITSVDAATDYGIDITHIENVSAEESNKYTNGNLIIKKIVSLNDIKNTYEARSFFLKDLKGYGIEFGAATSPSPVPDDCEIEYADYFQEDDGCNRCMNGDFVSVKFFTSLDEMEGIKNNSLNFIIGCHVIEHVSRTLLALTNCFDKLKTGGITFLVVPHMKYTFDALRSLTTIEHFIQDYTNYIRERDMLHLVDHLEHFTEYEANQKGIKADRINLFPVLKNFIKGEKIDIHYHTFTEENFKEILDYFNSNIAKWSKTEIIPRIQFEGSNEFYVRLTK